MSAFSTQELERYARHIVLREVGGTGQSRLKAASALVIGAGGLGSPLLLYLAAAGVGRIGVVDDDVVSLSNLQRQILHDTPQVGTQKTASAARRIGAINPHVTLDAYNTRLDGENAADLIAPYDLILDGSDNFATRYAVNTACVSARKPLIAAAISQWEGQVALYAPHLGGPCFRCVFPRAPAPGLAPDCAEAGVMGALAGVVGSMMATEAIKFIAGAGTPLLGRLLIYDALYSENRVLETAPREDCADCGAANRVTPGD